jgi:hypothetical protein
MEAISFADRTKAEPTSRTFEPPAVAGRQIVTVGSEGDMRP